MSEICFWGFFLSAMFGACMGILIMALCIVSKREDEK